MTDTGEVDLDYFEENGPGIPELNGDAQRQLPAGADDLDPLLPGWERETIETFLQGAGAGVHMLIGQTESDWLMTSKDLQRIAPPLTRICNRWEPALRLSPLADPLLVAHGFALYGWRSALEAKRAQRDREAEEAGPGYESPGASDDEPEDLTVDAELEEPPSYFPNARRSQL